VANILFDFGHPADIHTFYHAVKILKEDGHFVHISTLDRDIMIELLDSTNLNYGITYRRGAKLNLLQEIPIRSWQIFRQAQSHSIDVAVSVTNLTVGFPMWLRCKPYIAISDTEQAFNQIRTALPFAKRLITPDSFYHDYGSKQVRYVGTKELAYLHPDVYTPDISVLNEVGISPTERYSILRLSAWRATHDVDKHGLSYDEKIAVVNELVKYGKVIVSAEDEVPEEFQHLITNFPKERMHDLMAFASLYIGEGATMAAESCVLGTPAILTNTLDLGYLRDLQRRELMFSSVDGEKVLHKIREILDDPESANNFPERANQFIAESESLTDVLVREIRQHFP